MTRRVKLPVVSEEAPERTIEAMRASLGGRAAAHARAGEVVTIEGRGGEACVLLFVEGGQAHVWVGGGLVRRVSEEHLRAHGGEAPGPVASVSAAVQSYAQMTEGDLVLLLGKGGGEGEEVRLLEKCRHGALVERGDGTVAGVGFARLKGL